MNNRKIPVVLVGALGYGAYYRQLLCTCVPEDRFLLAGIVDPLVKSIDDQWQLPYQVPLYPTLESFYENHHAELAIISSPILLHYEQCLTAFQNGSHVLCEKPLVPTIQEALSLKKAAEQYHRLLGVGFQWSFCTPILSLKRDIQSGVFGKPLMLTTMISWQRSDRYYESSSWKGRIYAQNKALIRDSIATNATAHYLHNLFFLMGDKLNTASVPSRVEASTYRAKHIESFDTCFIRGKFENQAEFLYAATHSGDVEVTPRFRYVFENATIEMLDDGKQEPHIIASFHDGHVTDYGNPQSNESSAEKILRMLHAIQSGEQIPCGAETILPCLAVTTGLFLKMPIYDFPKNLCYREKEPAGTYVHGLTDDCLACTEEGKLPSELGFSWAQPETTFRPGEFLSSDESKINTRTL